MTPQLMLVLQMTVIGMGLVFGAILLLWGLMAALVRLTAEAPAPEAAPVAPAVADVSGARQAAAVAVAIGLAQRAVARADDAPHVFPLPPTAIVSAWQAVRRAQQLSQRGPVR